MPMMRSLLLFFSRSLNFHSPGSEGSGVQFVVVIVVCWD